MHSISNLGFLLSSASAVAIGTQFWTGGIAGVDGLVLKYSNPFALRQVVTSNVNLCMNVQDGDDFAGLGSIGDDDDLDGGFELAQEFFQEVKLRDSAAATAAAAQTKKKKKTKKMPSPPPLGDPMVVPDYSSPSAGLFGRPARMTVYSVPSNTGSAVVTAHAANPSRNNNGNNRRGLPRLPPLTSKSQTTRLGFQAMIAYAILSGYWIQGLFCFGIVGLYFVLTFATSAVTVIGGGGTTSDMINPNTSIGLISSVQNGIPMLENFRNVDDARG